MQSSTKSILAKRYVHRSCHIWKLGCRRVEPRFESPDSEDSTQSPVFRFQSSSDLNVDLAFTICNGDCLCWPHCNADTAQYLETAECRVEPRFESP
ncbi:hypothetical protein J6590_099313 [Homalodisca vitripennis]|nr:hypothetical protein J6590_099313 [Homalodisca vitripennis]